MNFLSGRKIKSCFALIVLTLCFGFQEARAIVGQAEHYDEVKQKDLEEFQQNILSEESPRPEQQADLLRQEMVMKENQLTVAQGINKEKAAKEMADLKQQLLTLPRRRPIQ